MNKADREKISEVLELLSKGMTETAKRILRQLRDLGVKAGPSHDREDIGITHDETQIVDFITVRLGGA